MTCAGKIYVHYTIDDDGIHASCPRIGCGFERNLGFEPDIVEIIATQREHDERSDS